VTTCIIPYNPAAAQWCRNEEQRLTAFVPRTTAKVLVCLAGLVSTLVLSACAGQPAASTPLPARATASHTLPAPTATPTSLPPSATASVVPATHTPRPTQTTAPAATETSTVPAATDTPVPATHTAAPSASPAGSGDFAPAQPQVWNTALVGGDNQAGSCSASANAPYGLVLLTPGEGTLAMHNTVPEDYVLARVAANQYQYAGPSALGDGNLTLTVRFTSATTLEMTRSFVPSAEPGCTHQHNYTGAFRNNR
jgi:hypothetical protein